jgi:hypothetical protein
MLKPQDGQVRGAFFSVMGFLRYQRVADEGRTFLILHEAPGPDSALFEPEKLLPGRDEADGSGGGPEMDNLKGVRDSSAHRVRLPAVRKRPPPKTSRSALCPMRMLRIFHILLHSIE